MIYQEPMASLNPAMKVGKQLMEVPIIHEKVSKAEAYKRSLDLLKAVRLPDPERMMGTLGMLVRPGGALFISTINRNPKAYLFASVRNVLLNETRSRQRNVPIDPDRFRIDPAVQLDLVKRLYRREPGNAAPPAAGPRATGVSGPRPEKD